MKVKREVFLFLGLYLLIMIVGGSVAIYFSAQKKSKPIKIEPISTELIGEAVFEVESFTVLLNEDYKLSYDLKIVDGKDLKIIPDKSTFYSDVPEDENNYIVLKTHRTLYEGNVKERVTQDLHFHFRENEEINIESYTNEGSWKIEKKGESQ